MTTPNIPPEIRPVPSSALTGSRLCRSENMAAAAYRSKSLNAMMAGQTSPVRISPEVRETILEGLRLFKGDDLERAVHAFGRDPKGDNAKYIDRLKASRAKIESAIAFVEALP